MFLKKKFGPGKTIPVMGESNSDMNLESETITVYAWCLFSRFPRAVLRKLCLLGVEHVRLISLIQTPARMLEIPSDKHPLAYPITLWARRGRYLSVRELELFDESVHRDDRYPFSISYIDEPNDTVLVPTGTIDFLGKSWKWSELLLNLVETFGASLEKSLDDPLMPEDFLFECMRRNLGVEMVKDCRVILHELQSNGMIEEVSEREYRLLYNAEYFGLNMNRSIPSENENYSLSDLVRNSIHLLSRVKDAPHSVPYLDFLDSVSWFQGISFTCFIGSEELRHKRRKILVDLHCMMMLHIDILRVVLEKERDKFFYKFKDQQLHLSQLRNHILQLTQDDPQETENINSLLFLKWTLSGDPETDSKILSLARDEFIKRAAFVDDSGTLQLPSFMKSTHPHKSYEICISPFI